MSGKKDKAQVDPQETEKTEETFSDGWLSWLLLAFFLLLCLAAWWLVQRNAVPGAPYAPIGHQVKYRQTGLDVANSHGRAYN